MTFVFSGPAFASHQFLLWTDGNAFTTFGPGSSITVDTGAIEFECDTFFPIADIYVMRRGELGHSGGTLTDVSGTPNTVTGSSVGGAFVGETIGFVGSGGIGRGTYVVVYDECQNGVLDPIDKVFAPAFEVIVPGNAPLLPVSNVAKVKEDATANVAKAKKEAVVWGALFIAHDI